MGHKQSVRQTDDEPAGIQAADLGGRLHDGRGDEDADAGDPKRHLAAEVARREARRGRGDEGPEDHERRDELLPLGVDVPT